MNNKSWQITEHITQLLLLTCSCWWN